MSRLRRSGGVVVASYQNVTATPFLTLVGKLKLFISTKIWNGKKSYSE